MKETHNSMDHLLSAANYQEYKWLICGDLKVVGLVLGFQVGYTNHPCFLYLWDTGADGLCQTNVAIKTRVKTWLV